MTDNLPPLTPAERSWLSIQIKRVLNELEIAQRRRRIFLVVAAVYGWLLWRWG